MNTKLRKKAKNGFEFFFNLASYHTTNIIYHR